MADPLAGFKWVRRWTEGEGRGQEEKVWRGADREGKEREVGTGPPIG